MLMAVLSATELTPSGARLGNLYLKVFSVVVSNANAANEWVATGLSNIVGILGAPALLGTTPPTDTPVAAARASEDVVFTGLPSEGDTITIDGIVYTFRAVPVEGARATATVTFGTGTLDNELVTVNGRAYKMEGTPAAIDDVDISATAAVMAQNFAHAINGSGLVADLDPYFQDTMPNRDCYATVSGAVVTLHARERGVAGNALSLTTDVTGASVSGALFTGGTEEYAIDIGSSASDQGDNLERAIMGTGTRGTDYSRNVPPHPSVEASNAAGTVTITARAPGTAGNSIAMVDAFDNGTLTSPLSGGLDAGLVALGASSVLNAQGTGVAAGTDKGDLGLEASVAGTYLVAVYGRP